MSDGSQSPRAVHSMKTVGGRVSLNYPCLDFPWLVHGTVVFRDRGFESRGSEWRGLVAGFMASSVSPPPAKVVIPVQVHGNRVVRVDRGGDICGTPTCDGLVTAEPGVAIGVNTADCVPLLAVSPEPRVVGVAHCGWRGIAAGVVESLIVELEAAGADPHATDFLIGPSVGACCYEVGQDFLDAFSRREVIDCSRPEGGGVRFDLRRLVRMRLADEGIDRAAVFTDNTCTSCASGSLCSYRAQGDACGRMYTYGMIVREEQK